MICIVEDRMPHIKHFYGGADNAKNILYAYKDLTTAYAGIRDFVFILDGIAEGYYSIIEVMLAGMIITDGLDGYLIVRKDFIKAKYIRINDEDYVMLADGSTLYFKEVLDSCEFDGNNGIRYQFDSDKRNTEKRQPALQS